MKMTEYPWMLTSSWFFFNAPFANRSPAGTRHFGFQYKAKLYTTLFILLPLNDDDFLLKSRCEITVLVVSFSFKIKYENLPLNLQPNRSVPSFLEKCIQSSSTFFFVSVFLCVIGFLVFRSIETLRRKSEAVGFLSGRAVVAGEKKSEKNEDGERLGKRVRT